MFNLFMFGLFAVLSYSISSLASITFVDGLHITYLERIQLWATCLLYMAGAWFTLKEAFKVKHIEYTTEKPKIQYIHTGTKRYCYIGLYFICTFFSIFTTANMAFGAINRDSSYKLQESDTYKISKASKDLSISSVQANNDTISSLLKEKEMAVKTQMAQVDKWKTTAVSQRQKEINRANEIANSYDAKIAKLRQSNENMQSTLSAPLPTTTNQTTASGSSLIDVFGLNEKTMMIIIAISVLILSVGVDLLGAFFTVQYSFQSYIAKSKSKKTSSDFVHVHENSKVSAQPKLQTTFKIKTKNPQTTFAKKENDNKIGFKFDKNDIKRKQENKAKHKTLSQPNFTIYSKDDVERYKQEMYRTQKNGDSKGFRTIAKSIEMDTKKAEKIKGHLETLGIVKVVGNRTRILKEI